MKDKERVHSDASYLELSMLHQKVVSMGLSGYLVLLFPLFIMIFHKALVFFDTEYDFSDNLILRPVFMMSRYFYGLVFGGFT